MFSQRRRRRWSKNNFKQTLGHPHCDNNYATLFVECRLRNYVDLIIQQSSFKSDDMSLKKCCGSLKFLQRLLMIT